MSSVFRSHFLLNGLYRRLSEENLDVCCFSSANGNSFLEYHWIYSLAIQLLEGSCTTLASLSETWADCFPLNGWTKVMPALVHEVAHAPDKTSHSH